MDLTTAARLTIRGEMQLARIRTKSRVARHTVRLDKLSLGSRHSGLVFAIHGVCHSHHSPVKNILGGRYSLVNIVRGTLFTSE